MNTIDTWIELKHELKVESVVYTTKKKFKVIQSMNGFRIKKEKRLHYNEENDLCINRNAFSIREENLSNRMKWIIKIWMGVSY